MGMTGRETYNGVQPQKGYMTMKIIKEEKIS